MKIARVICCLFVLLLSLVAFAFTTSAPSAHAASGTTFVFRFHGLSAQADFDNLSPDGCIDTFVFVDGSQNTVNKQTFSRGCTKSQAARFSLYLMNCFAFCLARRVSMSRSIVR